MPCLVTLRQKYNPKVSKIYLCRLSVLPKCEITKHSTTASMRSLVGNKLVPHARHFTLALHKPTSRGFSTSKFWEIKTTELSGEQLAEFRIDPIRLWSELHKTCKWGIGERWGE